MRPGAQASAFLEKVVRRCVYSVLTGDYEAFNDQPLVDKSEGVAFICFTDDPSLQRPGWEFRPIRSLFDEDPARTQREFKIRPHRHLADFDVSLYVDNSVLLTASPVRVFDRYGGSSFAAAPHTHRATLLEELAAVLDRRLDEEGRVLEQFSAYQASQPQVLSQRPFWGGILLRRHKVAEMVEFGEVWSAHVNRYSRRDQLSINAAMDRAAVTASVMRIDNHASWFHAWPRHVERVVERRVHAGPGAVDLRRAALAEALARQTLERQTEAIVTAQRILTNRQLARDGAGRSLDTAVVATQAAANLLARSFVRCGNGRVLFVDPAGRRGSALVERGGVPDHEAMHLWRHLVGLEEWTDVVDVGANFGEMLVNVDPPEGARVVACEPDPRVGPFLESTLARLPFPVELVRKAVALGSTTLAEILAAHPAPADRRRVLLRLDVEERAPDVLSGLGPQSDRYGALHVMLKTRHLADDVLRELLGAYAVHLFERRTRRLMLLDDATLAGYRRALSDDRFHARHPVLTRKGTKSGQSLS